MNIFQPHVVDGYKLGHCEQYVPKTELVAANMTPRSNKLARAMRENFHGKVVFFGLQYAIKVMLESWNTTFFSVEKDTAISKYRRRIKTYLGDDHGDTQIALMGRLHDLGYLPLEIKALPEGSRVNMQVPVFTVKNTHPDFFWLVNYVETYLSCMVWPMCNAASLAEQYWLNSVRYGNITSSDSAFWASIANHCFAGRGHRGMEDAMISGMGHLLFSFGTDTLWAIDGMEEYYNADCENELIAVSVNAAEHATATQRIAYFREKHGFAGINAEVESIRDFATRVYPTGIFSYVSDSEDYFGLLEHGIPLVKDDILNRQPDSNGLVKFVFRPDSSPKTPLEVICGDPDAPEGSAERKGTIQLLWDTFGGTINDKGYRVLNPKVGVIYGEAINLEMQDRIYATLEANGWCVTNVLMGVGSWGFLEMSSRDSYGFAVKGTHSIVDGEDLSMQKSPKTAMDFKKSAKGFLRVEEIDGDFVLFDEQTLEQEQQGVLTTVYHHGNIINETTLNEIRKRLGFV